MTKDLGICKLCKERRKLVKAHVIPEAFYRDMIEGDAPLALFSATPGKMPQRSQIGLYETEMVCQACEERFGPWDTYGVEFLRRPLSEFRLLLRRGETRAYAPLEFDYVKFKLFALSVLWRAHFAMHDFWSNVDLGPFAEPLGQRLLAGDPGGQFDLPVYMARYEGEPGPIIESPTKTRSGRINKYKFHFAMHDIVYCVDSQRLTGEWFAHAALSPDQPPTMLISPLIGGPKTDRLYRTAEILREVELTWPKMPRYLQDLRAEGSSIKE